jgi:cardiolipin synthase
MNIPNLLSIFRFFLTFFFIMAVNNGRLHLALFLFILQGVSDLLDGFLARVMGKKTHLGAFLDPIADKTMLVASFILLYLHQIIPLWLTSLVLIRDLVIACGFLVLYRLSCTTQPAPSIFGKITTACQIVTVVYVLWSEARPYGDAFFYITALSTAVSGIHYIIIGLRMLYRGRLRQPANGN